jgi:hypothetical protein
MSSFLTREQLHGHLRDQGHKFWSAKPEAAPINVSPPPEEYVTVALEPDSTLKPEYRDCYFACVLSDDDVPVICDDPEFALPEPFATVAEQNPINNYFMMGPFRWLLRRIAPFSRILLWPRDGFHGDTTQRAGPHFASWIARHAADPSVVGAVVLNLSELSDCQVLWEVAEAVGVDCDDYFVSDLLGREVYCLHHHDKIVISIPDNGTRREVLDDLESLSGVLDDWSGFESKFDDETG